MITFYVQLIWASESREPRSFLVEWAMGSPAFRSALGWCLGRMSPGEGGGGREGEREGTRKGAQVCSGFKAKHVGRPKTCPPSLPPPMIFNVRVSDIIIFKLHSLQRPFGA